MKRTASLVALLVVLGVQESPAQGRQPAQQPDDLLAAGSDAARTVSGQWDLAVPRNNLKCRIQFNLVGQPPKSIVGMPAPCRKSMGAMGRIENWGLTPGGALRVMGPRYETIAEFVRADAGVMKATLGANEFTLEPMGGRYPSPERAASIDSAMQRLNAPQAETPSTPSAVAGRYQLYRGGGANTGCVLVLDRSQPGPVSLSGRALLEKGCADQGLLTFDPAGWIVERDRMFLYARKGHRFGFNIERSGQLVKDPAQGSPLSATKL